MNKELIQKLQYTHAGQEEAHSLPLPLIESLQLISDFFSNSSNHKLCLVFPTKEFAAQWLSIPTVLFLIESDFAQFKNEITESLEKYKKGDWIILNNEAVVEWVGRNVNGFIFKHKVTRPKKSLHFLLVNPDSNLHIFFNPKCSLLFLNPSLWSGA